MTHLRPLDTSVRAVRQKPGPWPYLAAGFLLLHATGMFFAVRAAVTGGGAREVRTSVSAPAAAVQSELEPSDGAESVR